ncbi:MAG: DUF3604 domain-containing protein, partial [Mangrovicoccus sp.]|nr:DUF3604 domain-containing protein [Mangrovicoccus sp.]
MNKSQKSVLLGSVFCLFASLATAQNDIATREAALPENPLKEAYFGETHVHTSYSLDAFVGGARLTPEQAYRFAKGETMLVNGMYRNIGRPLDFAAISDHAEFLGELYTTQNPDAEGYDQPVLEELRHLEGVETQLSWFGKYVRDNLRSAQPTHPEFYMGPETTKNGWQVILDAAAQHYDPGTFTTIPAFEWSATQEAGNMHRNVLFRDMVVPDLPISALDTNDEEKLWAWMAEQDAAGSTLLAIPHNSNGSSGKMFAMLDNADQPLTAEYAAFRIKYERLVEMMQIKGNSEVTRHLWGSDEFADFENGDSVNTFSDRARLPENYVRWAITQGNGFQDRLGQNPFKLGFVGGTDNHNGAPGDAVEDNYLVGSHGPVDKSIEARRKLVIDGWINSRDSNPGSLTGVWAPKNTRGAIWDAMYHRESFVTSGPRIKPRFFAGAALKATDDPVALVQSGYEAGVPMGGTLSGLSAAPTFNVHALRDPFGANLDRIQIIKGWVDGDGAHQERIINVAWSGDRALDDAGLLPPVGNTVDLGTATYGNTIGAPELIGSWTDPDFDPSVSASYYMRVIEIPTPRWSTYDAV